MIRRFSVLILAASLVGTVGTVVLAQRGGMFGESHDHLVIRYSSGHVIDPIAALNAKLESGEAHLASDGPSGYLRAVLEALQVPVESQTLVFSPTSFQALRINARNPRALYFNDTVHVGWVRGGDILEFAVQDPRQGVIFYTFDQHPQGTPRFKRNDACLACHLMPDTLKVPGLLLFSTSAPEDGNSSLTAIDHRTPLEERWAGWYVTGSSGSVPHLGNIIGKGPIPTTPIELPTVSEQFDTAGYLSPHSDIAALMVLEHQGHVTNLLTRVGWESRVVDHQAASPARAFELPSARAAARPETRLRDAIVELVDYMLFIDEAPLKEPVRGSSGFARTFATQGPADGKGRSFRQLDLERRLLRYPCSYMIYSPAFDALSPATKAAVYARMSHVLAGNEKSERYQSLTAVDRRAIVEILRETKSDLPAGFGRS